MAAYISTAWVNNTAPAINATNLNKIEAGIAASGRPDTIQTWAKPQRGSWATKTAGVFAASEAQNFKFAPTANLTIGLPTDIATVTKQQGLLFIDATTYTISWATGWYFTGGVAPDLTNECVIAYSIGEDYGSGAGIVCGTPVQNIGQV